LTFLNPFFLIGLLGTGIPLVIHLLNLRTARRVDFSTLEFLRRVEPRSLRRVRVRQLLLLVLRMLAIAAVAVSMARPALTGTSGGGRGSVAAAIVLDASLSMRAMQGDRPVFEAGRERALEVARSFGEGDEVFVFLPGAIGEERAVGLRDLGIVRDRIAAAAPGAGAANLERTLREAAGLLATTRRANRELHVISDFQRTAWPEVEEDVPLPEGVSLFLIPAQTGDPPANVWVESIDYSGQILDTGNPIEIRSVVACTRDAPPGGIEASLTVDGRASDRRRAQLASAGRVSVVFRETFPTEGVHFGSVEVGDGGSLVEDDTRSFTLRTDREVPVLVVSGDPEAARFLAAAIAPGDDAGPSSFVVRRGEPRELVTLSREREAVLVLADVERFATDELDGIKAFLSSGGGLLAFAGPRVDASAWTRDFLPRFLPARFGDARVAPAGDTFAIARLDPSHPLLEIFRGEGGALADVRASRALTLVPETGTSVLATFSNGVPALAESSLLPGRVLLVTTGLDPTWSDLPLTGSFLPFVHESIRHLAQSSSKEARSIEIGEGATIALASPPEGGSAILRAPSGAERQVAARQGPGGWTIELPGADEPGLWVFTSARGDTLAAFAVNVPARESDLTQLAPEEISSRMRASSSAVLDAAGDLERQVREARVGREIGGWFLAAAVLFLGAEMAVAGRAGRVREGDPA
jgi:hypothetical protein